MTGMVFSHDFKFTFFVSAQKIWYENFVTDYTSIHQNMYNSCNVYIFYQFKMVVFV